jgi:hypothetical protein
MGIGSFEWYCILSGVRVMVFNATFNNISVISWRQNMCIRLRYPQDCITTKVVRSIPVYSIQHCLTKFVSDLWQLGGFLKVVRFPPPMKLTVMIQKQQRKKKEIVNEIRSYMNVDKKVSHLSVTRILILDMLTHFCHFKYKKDVKIPQGGVNWRTKKGYITGEEVDSSGPDLCQKWPRICSVCRNHNPVLSSFMTCHRVKKHIPVYGIRSESEKTNNIYRA